MAKRSLAGPGTAGSVKTLKQNLKKAGGGERILRFIPKDANLVVRFLTEPEEWLGYYEVYDEAQKSAYPLLAGMTNGHKGEEGRFRYLAGAVVTDGPYDSDIGKAVPLTLPKTLVDDLVGFYEKYGTIKDRDYDLNRTGDGFDTKYKSYPEAPTKFSFKRHEKVDLEEALLNVYDALWGGDDDDDESEDEVPTKPAPRSKAKKRAEKAAKAKREPVDVEDDVSDDEDISDDDESLEVVDVAEESSDDDDVSEVSDEDVSDEDEDEEAYTEDELLAMSKAELVDLAEEWGIDLPDKVTKKAIVAMMMDEGEEA